MNRLPLELTTEILKYLDQAAIKALRLACKSLASDSAPILFRHVSIFIQEHSLNMLLQISKQAHLRHYVKTLRIGLELLPVDERNGWVGCQHMVDGEVCCGWDCKSSIHIDSFIKAQKQLELSGRGVKMLTDTFQNLPALKSVTIGFPDHPDGSNPESHGFQQLGLHYVTDPEGFNYLDGSNACRFQDCGRIQLQYLLRAGDAAGLQLNHLKLCGTNDSGTRSYPHSMSPSFMNLSASDMACAKAVLRHIRDFQWIMPDCYDRDSGDTMNQSSLNSVLKKGYSGKLIDLMPSLEAIFIEPSGERGDCTLDHGLMLRDLVGWRKKHSLRKVEFYFLEFDEDDYVEYLSSQSDTLKSVTFLACGLYTGSMKSLCNRLRTRLSLEQFRMSTGLHEYHGEDVRKKDYGLWDDNENLDSTWVIERAVTDALEDFVVERTDKYPTGWVSCVRERGDSTESDEESEDEFEMMPKGPWFREYGTNSPFCQGGIPFKEIFLAHFGFGSDSGETDIETESDSFFFDEFDESDDSEESDESADSLPGLVGAP
ncbi:hypothetical protein ONS95_003929 [Cadophora gregata]|uniref:uncharacterized protein n=1 Tax=Cadophora gregata TaxID=51156 RepID=UPI0026DB26B9|nr:uncharacterized protein ONS95_003929 [Cadophora gregata]KAK0107227.1 hypothetical protein ONS95_003929 [Cadophora gregata]